MAHFRYPGATATLCTNTAMSSARQTKRVVASLSVIIEYMRGSREMPLIEADDAQHAAMHTIVFFV